MTQIMVRHILSQTLKTYVQRQIGYVPMHLIDIDRVPTQRVLGLVRHLAQFKSVPPIHLRKEHNGRYTILDGRHRFMAAKLLGFRRIFARWADVHNLDKEIFQYVKRQMTRSDR